MIPDSDRPHLLPTPTPAAVDELEPDWDQALAALVTTSGVLGRYARRLGQAGYLREEEAIMALVHQAKKGQAVVAQMPL